MQKISLLNISHKVNAQRYDCEEVTEQNFQVEKSVSVKNPRTRPKPKPSLCKHALNLKWFQPGRFEVLGPRTGMWCAETFLIILWSIIFQT